MRILIIIFLISIISSEYSYSQVEGFSVKLHVGEKLFDCKNSHPIDIGTLKVGDAIKIRPYLYDTCHISLTEVVSQWREEDSIYVDYAPEDMRYSNRIKIPFKELVHIVMIEVWVIQYNNNSYTIEYTLLLDNGKKYEARPFFIAKKKYASKHTKRLLKQGYSKKKRK